eukprot:scaffold87218_cov21-Tisochrysis_lutea.AAC.4
MHPLPAPLADHAPMSTFRGAPLTHEVAEDMLIGWMDPGRGSSPFSWLVAAGKNPVSDTGKSPVEGVGKKPYKCCSQES